MSIIFYEDEVCPVCCAPLINHRHGIPCLKMIINLPPPIVFQKDEKELPGKC